MRKTTFFNVIPAVLAATAMTATITAEARGFGVERGLSPLRGIWSFSQMVPSTTLLTGSPVPLVAVGTLEIDGALQFSGNGAFNTPVPGQQFIKLAINGHCSPREGEIRDGLDCVFNFPEFDLFDVNRFCVVMASERGRCFDEFRCVNVDEPGETVALMEFKRQQSGTCR